MRDANPLEEIGRSWRKNPEQVILELHSEELEKFRDFDKDEAEAKARIAEKWVKRKALLIEAGKLKAK